MIARKLRTVLIAALAGAALPLLLILFTNATYGVWGPRKSGSVMSTVRSFLVAVLVIPAGYFSRGDGSPTNPYIVDPLIGAVVFGLGALCWQFLGKDKNEN